MTTANVVKSGSWCPHCAGRCKSIVDMQQLAASKNGTCLSHEYKGNRHKLEWACEYGHRWFAVPHSISDGSWCPRCASTKNSERARKHNYDEGVDLYLAGRSVVYVAEQLHIDMYGLWREINRKGLVRRDRKYKDPRIKSMFLDGKSQAAIARDLGYSRCIVKMGLEHNGLI